MLDVKMIERGLSKPGKTKGGLAAAMGVRPGAVSEILSEARLIKASELQPIIDYLELNAVPIMGRVGAGATIEPENEQVPPEGLGRQIEIMYAWLDETCGAEGWGMAPAGFVGVLNDAIAFYFDDAAFAHAFVARFCCGYRVEAVEGAFALRNDTPPLRRGAPVHKTL